MLSLLDPVTGGFPLSASFLYPVRNKGKGKRGGEGSTMSHLGPEDSDCRIRVNRQHFQVGHTWKLCKVSRAV